MADEKIQLDITARDKASDAIDDVADKAEHLEDLSPEVTVTADTDSAVANIRDVDEAAGRLSGDDTVLVIKAQIDQAKGQLKELEGQLKQTEEAADDTAKHLDKVDGGGSNLRGNAIADLTGPLGEASSAASDFAGVFDGLGDAAEAAAGKLGLSEDIAGKLSSAIGGLGVAVAAGAAIWSIWTQRQKAAEQAAKEHTQQVQDLGKAIAGADRAAAVSAFHKLYDDAIASATRFGLKQQDVIDFITGERDAIPGLTDRYHELTSARDNAASPRLGATYQAEITALQDQQAALDKQRQSYLDSVPAAAAKTAADAKLADTLVGATDDQKKMTKAVADSVKPLSDAEQATRDLEDGYSRLDDRLSDKRAIEDWQTAMQNAQKAVSDKSKDTVVDVRGVEDAIVAAGKAAGLNPIVIQSAIDKVDQGDVDGAFLYMQQKIDEKGPLEVKVALHATIPKLKIAGRGGTQMVIEVDPASAAAVGTAAAAAPSTVNVNLPRGYRGDVVREVTGAARRNGRRYGARAVNLARR